MAMTRKKPLAPWEMRNERARLAWLTRGRTRTVYEMWTSGESPRIFDRKWREIETYSEQWLARLALVTPIWYRGRLLPE